MKIPLFYIEISQNLLFLYRLNIESPKINKEIKKVINYCLIQVTIKYIINQILIILGLKGILLPHVFTV